MAVLTRVNLISNERLDLPDFENLESFAVEDFNALLKYVFSGSSRILSGFRIFQDSATLNDNPTTSPVFIKLAGSTLFHTETSGKPFMYVGAVGLSAAQLNLTANATNYVELDLTITTSAPDSRAVWDPSANGGQGAEFTQIVDTARDLTAAFSVNQVGFSGGTKVPIAEIVMTGSTITALIDRRNMFFRLGTGNPADPNYVYPWSQGRTEPNPDRKIDPNAFIGADKSINDFRAWMEAVMTAIQEMKGGSNWFSPGSSLIVDVNLSDLFQDAAGSVITGTGKWQHSASIPGELTWTSNIFIKSIIGNQYYTIAPGVVTLSDGQVAYISLVRNQAQLGNFTFTNASTTVSAASGSFTNFVVGDWIKAKSHDQSTWRRILSFNTGVPATAVSVILDAVYTGASVVDQAALTKQVYTVSVANGTAVPADGNSYWLAKRDDNGGSIARIYLRGLAEIEQGEEEDIDDPTSDAIFAYMGSAGEADYDPNYVSAPAGSLALPNFNGVNGEDLTVRLAKVTAMLADVKQDFNVELDPGDVTWDGTNISVTSAQLSIPGTTIGAAPVAINTFASAPLAANSCLYVDINRTTAGALTLASSTLAALTPSQQRLVVARNIGGVIFVR